eukprot:12229812-Karenia_brevis.AAC.1
MSIQDMRNSASSSSCTITLVGNKNGINAGHWTKLEEIDKESGKLYEKLKEMEEERGGHLGFKGNMLLNELEVIG